MKRKLFLILVIVISFLVGNISTHYVLSHYFNSKFKGFYWPEDPIIVICSSSKIKISKLEESLEYWKEKGYYTKYAIEDPSPSNGICSMQKLDGFIYINDNLGMVTGNSLAITERSYDGVEIKYVDIEIPNENLHLDLLLEHELGHAFGFNHYNRIGHIMNPLYERMGEEFYFPKRD